MLFSSCLYEEFWFGISAYIVTVVVPVVAVTVGCAGFEVTVDELVTVTVWPVGEYPR